MKSWNMSLLFGVLVLVGGYGSTALAGKLSEDAVLQEVHVVDYDLGPMAFLKAGWSTANQQGCEYDSQTFVGFDPTSEIGKAMFSAALAAYLAGKTVTIVTDGCYMDFPKVHRVNIK